MSKIGSPSQGVPFNNKSTRPKTESSSGIKPLDPLLPPPVQTNPSVNNSEKIMSKIDDPFQGVLFNNKSTHPKTERSSGIKPLAPLLPPPVQTSPPVKYSGFTAQA